VWPAIGLCWGTVRQASLLELVDVAALYGFPTITVPPHVLDLCLASGTSPAALRRRLSDNAIRVTVIDALTRDLPGAADIDEVPVIWRDNWRYGLEDLIRMAEALEAPTINVTHYLGKPVTPQELAQGIAGLAQRAERHGLKLSLEFIPGTSMATLPITAKIVLLAAAPNVGIMLDVWHLLNSGGGVEDIRALPPGSLNGVQLNDRRTDAAPSPRHTVWDRSLPGEDAAPLKQIVQAMVDNSPDVSFEIEVFSSELVALSPSQAGSRVAHALADWQRALNKSNLKEARNI
jgi:sugar phosphate isomerase/epimerase